MCTSLVWNGAKTIVGWNLDILDMEYRVFAEKERVCICIYDAKEGWLPLFGVNAEGIFVTMPTCWPYDPASDPMNDEQKDIIHVNIDLLFGRAAFKDVCRLAQSGGICSLPGITYMAQHSDRNGNVLQIVPGQDSRFLERPRFSVMTNFSPFRSGGQHPWMGHDRYRRAVEMLENAAEGFDVADCFSVLSEVSQTVCPTVVSMVYDAQENSVFWCENREWDCVRSFQMERAGKP